MTTDSNPLNLFADWFDQASREIPDANAMTLATATPDGKPSARIVLLKSFDDRGFVFYTNYNSAKGKQLAVNPFAALVFFWQKLDRQVRIEGKGERVSAEESDEYFRSRPVGSQIGAHASPQSEIIPDRTFIEERYRGLEEKYAATSIPRPAQWGGYRVVPQTIEFWQGRANRLHDRIVYRRDKDGTWTQERLAP
ncbi:MAG: pyridoxamine 5'-phosphate oxidase [Ignavibacteriae bacterium]|nr:pyridoxamine 5'-phosphate oxidase [Ignavibacteriota bacterium]